jgi:radical SAM superfamily enzyme YgiQ (UPF0313 family)
MPGSVLLFSVNQCETPYPVFPLGLAHLAAALHRAGYQTRCYDFHVDREPLPAIVQRFRPDFIGISLRNIDDVVIKSQETYFGRLFALCRELRQITPVPIVLGGSGFSIFPERLLALSGADFGIVGEGETSLVWLLRALECGGDYSAIPGLVFGRGEEILRNPRAPRAELEMITAPDRPGRLSQFYLQKSSMLNIQTQRGCAFDCCYCTYPLIEGRSYMRRPPEEIAEELALLQGEGARYVFIVDSVFNSSTEHVRGVCEAILRRKVKMRWGCFLRPKHLTRDLMNLMARAGLAHIEFGSDSLCDEVLHAYGKRFTFEDIAHSTEVARGEKVDCCHFLICGGPGETRETLRNGYENSKRLQDAVILALVGMRIYPGTPLFTRAVQERRLRAESDLLQPRYYLSEHLSEDETFAELRAFSRQSPNWVVGEPAPEYLRMAERLRAKGVLGPLWSYFAMMQRLRGLTEGTAKPPQPQGGGDTTM